MGWNFGCTVVEFDFHSVVETLLEPERRQFVTGAETPDSGTVTWGHNAMVGYMPQDHHGLIKKGTTVYQWLRDQDVKMSNEEIGGLLGRGPHLRRRELRGVQLRQPGRGLWARR